MWGSCMALPWDCVPRQYQYNYLYQSDSGSWRHGAMLFLPCTAAPTPCTSGRHAVPPMHCCPHPLHIRAPCCGHMRQHSETSSLAALMMYITVHSSTGATQGSTVGHAGQHSGPRRAAQWATQDSTVGHAGQHSGPRRAAQWATQDSTVGHAGQHSGPPTQGSTVGHAGQHSGPRRTAQWASSVAAWGSTVAARAQWS